MEVTQDVWISDVPLSRWPTLISIEVDGHMRVFGLVIVDGSSRRREEITRLFGGPLAKRILTIPIPVHPTQDATVWGCSCCLRVSLRDFS